MAPKTFMSCLYYAFAAMMTVCALSSCTSLTKNTPAFQGGFLKNAALGAFTSVDPYEFSKANAVMALNQYRSAPPQEVIGKKAMTIDECREIALANNLEIQAAAANEITKRWVEYSSKTRLLPHFSFSGDLSDRDNLQMSFSQVWGDGFSLPPDNAAENARDGAVGVNRWSRGHERSTWRYVFETKWSPTDAALAYYVAKSSSNDRIKSHFGRIRAAQKLISVVDSAFMRLLALQKALPVAENLVKSRERVLDNMKYMFDKKLVTVDDYNRANQGLARARRSLNRTTMEIDKQRNILATAMGLSPDACAGTLTVIGDLRAPAMNMQICDMEMHAVQKRPEAFEAGLANLSSDNDLKRLIIKNFPKVTGFWRSTSDKDVFLYNKEWKEVGALVYFDLLDWIANAEEMNAAVAHKAKTYHEMGSVALAITSQVRIAALQFHDSLDELRSLDSSLDTSREVYRIAQSRQARDDLDRTSLEEAKANMLSGQWEKYKALGEANAALAELESAMGLNYSEPNPKP